MDTLRSRLCPQWGRDAKKKKNDLMIFIAREIPDTLTAMVSDEVL